MNIPAILLACVALVAASSLATCHRFFNIKYLETSSVSITTRTDYCESLEKIHNTLMTDRISIRWAALQRAIADHQLNENQRDALIDMSNLEMFPMPTRHVTERFIVLCASLSECKGSLYDKFAELTYNHGRRLFRTAMISDSIKSLSTESPKNSASESGLDQLFAAILHLGIIKDRNMLDHLRHVDLTTTELDITPASQFTQRREFQELVGSPPLDIFISVMDTYCTGLRKDRIFDMDNIALAKTFGVLSIDHPEKIYKLNEYNRLCASLRTQSDNIRSHLTRYLSSAGQSSDSQHGHGSRR